MMAAVQPQADPFDQALARVRSGASASPAQPTPDPFDAALARVQAPQPAVVTARDPAGRPISSSSAPPVVTPTAPPKPAPPTPGRGLSKVHGPSIGDAIQAAVQSAKLGSILFSPAFASFGMFKNEYDRNDLFLKLVCELS